VSSGHGEIVFQVLRRISKSTGMSEVQGFTRSSITMQSFLSLYFIVDFHAGGGGQKVECGVFCLFVHHVFHRQSLWTRLRPAGVVSQKWFWSRWIGKGLCIRVQLCLYVIRWRHHRLLKLERQYNVGFSFQPKGDSGNLLCEWTLTVQYRRGRQWEYS